MVAKKPRIVIIGAGMAGLTAAHRLQTTAPDLVDVTVLEAGPRIGGRIFTSSFAGDQVEMGATWIHGIDGSPVYALAGQIGALRPSLSSPYERMDGFPSGPVTASESGAILDPSLVDSVSSLYKDLTDSARSDDLATDRLRSVGSYLRTSLEDQRGNFTGGDRATVDSIFEMNLNTERTFTSADDLDDLDLAAESEYREFPGDQITIARGYSRIIEALAAALPKDSVRLNSKVGRIDWCVGDGEGGGAMSPARVHVDGEGGAMEADHVIVTVSLGVLKAGLSNAKAGLEFKPDLPEFKKGAIGRLGFGVVDKLFVEIDGSGESEFPFLQLAFDGQAAEIPRWMRRTASVCPVYGGSRVLLAWLAGKEALEMEETEEEEEIAGGVRATLDAFLGSGRSRYGEVARVKRSGWGKDPLFRGSYSYVAVGSSGEDQDLMAEPLPRGGGERPMQVMFAGEATHRTHYSTTHGAYFSGIREANRLIQYYRCGNGNGNGNGSC